MTRANCDIRERARNAGVPLWAIAEEIGVSEATLTRRMRLELRGEEKRQLMTVIGRIAQREAKSNENEDNS